MNWFGRSNWWIPLKKKIFNWLMFTVIWHLLLKHSPQEKALTPKHVKLSRTFKSPKLPPASGTPKGTPRSTSVKTPSVKRLSRTPLSGVKRLSSRPATPGLPAESKVGTFVVFFKCLYPLIFLCGSYTYWQSILSYGNMFMLQCIWPIARERTTTCTLTTNSDKGLS